MPKIEQYVSHVSTPGAVDVPRANPDTMGAVQARAMGQFGDTISGAADMYQRAKEQDEISEVNKQMALAKADFSMDLQKRVEKGEISTDPETGEYTFTDDFKKSMQDRMEGIRGKVTTRKAQLHFDQDATQTTASFTVDAFRAQSQLIGLKARKDYETAFNARSSQLLNNPSSYQEILGDNLRDLDSRVESGQLSAQVAEQLKSHASKQLSKAYVEGWSRLDTGAAKKILDDGVVDQHIDSDTKYELYAKIRSQERANRVEENILKQQEKEAKHDQDMEFMDTMFTNIMTGKSKGVTRQILDSDLDWNKKKQLLDIMDHQANKRVKTDKATFLSLLDRIHAGDDDPQKIRSDEQLLPYATQGFIDMKALNDLRKEVRGYNTEAGRNEAQLKGAFFKDIQSKLVKKDAFGNADPQGQASYTNFIANFQDEYAKQIKAGKTPQQLLTPSSKDYLGTLVDPFMKTPQQRMRDQIQLLRPVPSQTPAPSGTPAPRGTPDPEAMRKPGESTTDFLKRRGL